MPFEVAMAGFIDMTRHDSEEIKRSYLVELRLLGGLVLQAAGEQRDS